MFQLVFYNVILISWSESQIWQVNSGWFKLFFVFFLIVFQFYPLILDWLGIGLQNLFWFSFNEVIQVSWSKFGKLNRLIFFYPFLINFFKKIYHSILSWLRIRLQNIFRYTFYKVIMVSWPGLQILHVNLDWPELT